MARRKNIETLSRATDGHQDSPSLCPVLPLQDLLLETLPLHPCSFPLCCLPEDLILFLPEISVHPPPVVPPSRAFNFPAWP